MTPAQITCSIRQLGREQVAEVLALTQAAGDGTDVEELLRRAELCLSAAKAAGRDRVASVPSTVDGVAAA